MANITASMVKELREKTSAGMLDCKKALAATDGNMEEAVTWLREKGIAKAAKKSDRIASNGRIGVYNHMNQGQICVMVEVNCETDFVSKTDKFIELVNNIAMHIAASRPQYLTREDVPEAVVNKEQEIAKAQAIEQGKPEAIAEKMVAGRMEKFYGEVCLNEQPYVKNPDMTITDLVNEATMQTGEKVAIRRFVVFEVGEGMEKRDWNE